MSKLARALYGFPPGSIVTKAMLDDRKACLDADPVYSDAAIRSYRGTTTKEVTMSYAPQVETMNEPGKFYGNALRFATREEAEQNAKDLFNRWLLCTAWRAVESTDPVNYSYIDGKLESVAPQPQEQA